MINLKISDQELHQTLKNKAAEERRITKEVIIYIEEVIRRKLFLKYCNSLHEYLTEHIGYSEASAQRRIDAARVFSKVPEVAPAIEDGRLKLGQVAKVEKIVRELKKSGKRIAVAQQKEVLEKIANKNTRQTDLILAQEFDVAIKAYDKVKVQKDESVRLEITFSKEEMELLEEAQALLSNKTGGKLRDTIVEMAKKVIKDSKPRPPSGKMKAKSEVLLEAKPKLQSEPELLLGTKMKTQSELNLESPSLNQASPLESESSAQHLVFNTQKSINTTLTPTSAAEVNVFVPEVCVSAAERFTFAKVVHAFAKERHASVKKGHTSTNKKCVSEQAQELKSVTPKLKKEIKLRDQICQWIDPQTKKQCGSKFFLQVDHIKPKHQDGPNTPHNLRLLCKAHNIYRYERNL